MINTTTRPRPIMIVEDDVMILNSVVEVLQVYDRETLYARNGRAAIEMLKKLREDQYPCCIILDLMMPEMTGEEFIFHIQALGRVELDSIPIVVLSASTKMQLLDSPRVTYKLSKPVDINEIVHVATHYY